MKAMVWVCTCVVACAAGRLLDGPEVGGKTGPTDHQE